MASFEQIATERQTLNDTVRSFFRSRGYIEVETPILVASPGMEPNLSPFETIVKDHTGRSQQGALVTSPEYSMKKLLGHGLQKIFTITKVFRNGEEWGGTHSPEFSMLEWYAQGADYRACMDETEALVQAVFEALGARKPLPTFRRERVVDLFFRYTGRDLPSIVASESDTVSDAFYRLFVERVEPNLPKDPIFVYDYPMYQAALARLTPDKQYGERFELYIDGLELCNGFTELVNATEQRLRFEEEACERMALQKTVFPIDEEFLRLLSSVGEPTFGNALGLDRLHMAATGRSRLADVLLFPIEKLF